MTAEGRAIRSVCVAGTGIVGLSAALAFSRALPGVRVSLIETPSDPAAISDHSPFALPTINRFHAAIGLDELDLVRGGIAQHRLGTLFAGWSRSGAPWFQVHGEHGLPADQIPFHLLWDRLHKAGRARPYHLHAAAAVLAAAGKFVHPSEDPASPLSTFLYGLRLDPERYRARLDQASTHLPRIEGAIVGVEKKTDGGIAAVRLDGDRRIEADLYLDCTGPAASLLSQVATGYEDWGAWLPFDRIGYDEAPPGAPDPCDRVEAQVAGWRAEARLPERTLRIRASSAAYGEYDEATVQIRPGRRPRPWVHNVLALGDAAVAIDPLHGASLHLAHSMILRALELLPGRDMNPLELAEYGRRTEREALRILDFLALHFLRSGRTDPAWAELATRAPPPGLARTLQQYERRGRLPFFEEETFDRQAWAAALIGLGIFPKEADPVAAGVDLEKVAAAADALVARLERITARLPPYPVVLERMRGTARSAQG